VVLVDHFDESFNSGSFDELLFIDASFNCSWVSGNTNNG
jgi:hypothetical protein